MAALVRPDTGALDITRQTDTDLATLGLRLGLVRGPVVPADQFLELVQRGGKLPGVIDQRAAVLEDQPVVIRHFSRLDEIVLSDHGSIQPQLACNRVDRALHGIHALWTSRATIRSHDHGVRVEGIELDPVGARLVRPEQLGRRDDRHDHPVRDVGAVVIPEPHRQTQNPAVVIEADLDVLQLPTLVRR